MNNNLLTLLLDTASFQVYPAQVVLNMTASNALSASYFSGSITNAVTSISSSYSTTSSYALNGGTVLTTGSTYPITASWAITASYALNGGGLSLITGSTYPITSSNSLTSSYYNGNTLVVNNTISNVTTSTASVIIQNLNGYTGLFVSSSFSSILLLNGAGDTYTYDAIQLYDTASNGWSINYNAINNDAGRHSLSSEYYITGSRCLTRSLALFPPMSQYGNANVVINKAYNYTPINTLDVGGNILCNVITASLLLGTASIALSASYFSGSITTAVSASYSNTASYALNGGVATLTSGSTYNITASWGISSSYSSYSNNRYEDIDNGLIVYYPFSEGTGSYIHDYSGTGLTAYVASASNLAVTPGVWNNNSYKAGGYSLQFDGISSAVWANSIPAISGLPAITVGIWFNTTSSISNLMLASKVGGGGNGGEWFLQLDTPTEMYWSITNYAAARVNLIVSCATVNDGKWHYAVGTYNGTKGQMLLYLDGKLIGSAAQTGNIQTEPLIQFQIGAFSMNPLARIFAGLIDEFKMWNRDLSIDEIRTNWMQYPNSTQPYCDAYGNVFVTGSIIANSFTGSLLGTASYSNTSSYFYGNTLNFNSSASTILTSWGGLYTTVYTAPTYLIAGQSPSETWIDATVNKPIISIGNDFTNAGGAPYWAGQLGIIGSPSCSIGGASNVGGLHFINMNNPALDNRSFIIHVKDPGPTSGSDNGAITVFENRFAPAASDKDVNASNFLYANQYGNISIGHCGPAADAAGLFPNAKVSIFGSPSHNYATFQILQTSSSTIPIVLIDSSSNIIFNNNFTVNGNLISFNPTAAFQISPNGYIGIILTGSNGYVGINQSNPKYQEDVGGSINFTGNLYQNSLPYTASLATTASYAPTSVSSSWASSSLSSSVTNINTNTFYYVNLSTGSSGIQPIYVDTNGLIYNPSTNQLSGSLIGITASLCGSSSYANTASYALNGGGSSLTTGSTYPITASYSLTSSISNSGSVVVTSNNTNYYFDLSSGSAGYQPTYVGTGLTYNPSTNTLSGSSNIVTNNLTSSNAIFVTSSQQSPINIVTNVPSYTQLIIQNITSSVSASTDIIVINDQGSLTSNSSYVDMGINSSNYNQGFIGNGGDGYHYYTGSLNNNNFYIGNTTPSGSLYLFAGGSNNTSSIRIDNNGNLSGSNVLFTGNIHCSVITASSLLGTSSYASTSSYVTASNVIGTVNSSSYSLTSSYALNGGVATLTSGSTYNITSSWAITASYTLTGGSGGNIQTTFATIPTSSANWITASFTTSSLIVNITNGALYNFTCSNLPSGNNVLGTSLFINNTSTTTSSLSFPSNWVFLGSVPQTITSSKCSMLSLQAYGTQNVIAAWAQQY